MYYGASRAMPLWPLWLLNVMVILSSLKPVLVDLLTYIYHNFWLPER